ncbi:2-succinyl-5-enolpyruvyl-6-hydroxy-3-cyclohexene-1-carboxylic-acid synthase [Muriicola sp.]|uniref:2-succinyl-5-enolpyruvyl-6-hydroxy-3- cyclohexene-1-carboxylic-acid synthase n=1 Tax=Muriicola sp. TaxID=2020856 RepID=UPI003C758686
MKHPSIPSAQLLVQYCKAVEISQIVISPGSRNAPLIIGFTEDPYFDCYSIVDERCAAFFAAGMAQQLKHPVVVLCTSGSALLNYYPAVAEAFYSGHPLVIISADRPPYRIDIGDGQTIRQDHVFERHIGYSANLQQDVTHATASVKTYDASGIPEDVSLLEMQRKINKFNQEQLSLALRTAFEQRLPVHINVPFEEPLYNTQDHSDVHQEINVRIGPKRKKVEDVSLFAGKWNAAKRKMILVGVLPPNEIEMRWLDALASDPSVLIFTETTSNLHHPNILPSIDSIIAPIEKSEDKEESFKALQPEILLTFGGLVVSKKIKAFLRRYKPVEHWHVHEQRANDTFFCLSHHFKSKLNTFLEQFIPDINIVPSAYRDQWLGIRDHYTRRRTAYVDTIPFSDMWVFDKLMEQLPKSAMVQLANSSTVRYAQLFDMDPAIEVYCNRGTSGIDGSTSTAVGASIHKKTPTILITGDLSFFYDSNGLWNRYLRPDFRIILINNGGGGIFRILPGKEDSKNFRTFFETTHELNAKPLCEMYSLEYQLASDKIELLKALKHFYEASERPKLLEIKTPAEVNDQILLAYFDFISSN